MARIMIIEDDQAVQNLLRRHLEDSYEIVETADAARALALAMEAKPDCILLDLNLPDLSGFELCEMFSSLNATRLIPIVVITGEPALKYRELCLNLGATDYVEKPLKFADLKKRLAAALQSRRTERRKEPRVRLSVNLNLSGMNQKGNKFELPVTTIDVSVSGFSCMTSANLEVGSVVEVLIPGLMAHSAGRARVVHVQSEGTSRQSYGFSFIERTGQWILQ